MFKKENHRLNQKKKVLRKTRSDRKDGILSVENKYDFDIQEWDRTVQTEKRI